jgi:hypothetical protein
MGGLVGQMGNVKIENGEVQGSRSCGDGGREFGYQTEGGGIAQTAMQVPMVGGNIMPMGSMQSKDGSVLGLNSGLGPYNTENFNGNGGGSFGHFNMIGGGVGNAIATGNENGFIVDSSPQFSSHPHGGMHAATPTLTPHPTTPIPTGDHGSAPGSHVGPISGISATASPLLALPNGTRLSALATPIPPASPLVERMVVSPFIKRGGFFLTLFPFDINLFCLYWFIFS